MRFRIISKLTIMLLALIVLATCVTFGAVRQTAFAKPAASCPTASGNRIVAIAEGICNSQGQAINGWPGNLVVPYVYGGGHYSKSPGPNTGLKAAACSTGQTCGVDCSGFTRWVYYLAYQGDVLGAGRTQDQILLLTKVPDTSAKPGDLVYFNNKGTYHVGVYIGPNQMIDSPSAHGSLPHEVRLDQIKVGFGRVIGYYRYTSSQSGMLDWKYRTGGIVGSTPTVVNGVVYVGSDDYSMYAVNAITGAFIWRYQTGFYVSSTPAVVNGVVYFGSDDMYVYALNASNGKLKWKYQTSYFVESAPAVVNGVVYISSNDGYIYALNASTGALIWHTYTSSGASSPAVVNGVVYVGSSYAYVDALSASDGTILWQFQTGGVVSSSPVVVNGVVYVGCDDFNVYAINATTGTLIWSYATGGYGITSSAAVANGVVYIGDAGGHLYALNASKGTLIWRYQSQVDIINSPTVANGAVYIGLEDVYAFNAATGTLIWRYGTGKGFSTPTVVNGVVYVGSFDSYLYAIYA